MGKFDPSYEILLLNIPIAYNMGTTTVSALQYVSDNKTYSIPSGHQGVLNQLNSILSDGSLQSSITSVLDQYLNNIPSAQTLSTYSIGSSIANWYSSLLSSVPKPVSDIPNYMTTMNSVLSIAYSNVSSVANTFDAGVPSAYDYLINEVNNLPNVINQLYGSINALVSSTYQIPTTSLPIQTSVYDNANNLVLSAIRNIRPTPDYTGFLYSAPTIAYSLSEIIANDMLRNLEVAKKIYLSGYEKFAGKRIGLTNFIDVYTTRETLKTVKELKVNVYDRMLNAINEYFLKYYATELDLIKYFADYTTTIEKMIQDYHITIAKLNADLQITMWKNRIDVFMELVKGRLNVSALLAQALDVMSKFVNNKFNLAVSFITDVVRSASAFSSEVYKTATDVYSTYAVNLAKLANAVELGVVTSYNDAKVKEVSLRQLVGEMRLNYLQHFLSSKSYKYDRALEFLAHTAGVPNTINRGLSQFERTMLPVSVGANMLATVGNMVLPFL